MLSPVSRMKPALFVMSRFDLRDSGGGKFVLIGEMTFATADRILKSSERTFSQYRSVQVDLSQVDKADSAGLALLIEWKAQASQRVGEITFVSVPESLLSIASTAEVGDLI